MGLQVINLGGEREPVEVVEMVKGGRGDDEWTG